MLASRKMFSVLSLLFMALAYSQMLAQTPTMQLVSGQKGWAMDSRRLFWTTDDGDHWRDITPQSEGNVSDVFFLDAAHGWVLFSSDNGESDKISFHLARTSDSGGSWSVSTVVVQSQKPEELDGHAWLDFSDPLHGWVLLHANSSSAFSWGLLLSTSDGGKTWTELPQTPIAGRLSFTTVNDGWIVGNAGGGGIYQSHDGGRTWQGGGPDLTNLPPSLPTRPSYGELQFVDAKQASLTIRLRPANDSEEPRGTALVLYTTDDGGATWKRERDITDRGALSVSGGALASLGASAVVPGTSGSVPLLLTAFNDRKHLNSITLMTAAELGETTTAAAPNHVDENILWRQGDDVASLSFTDSLHGWARTTLGDVFRTRDAGTTWSDIKPIPVIRPPVMPAKGARVKAKKLGPGPKLVPESPQAGLHYTERLGFDEHNVATTAVMGTWFSMSPFFDVGFYVGGANYCGQWNTGHTQCLSRPDPGLSAQWIVQVQGQGWGFFPIWVGPQAPCVNATKLGKFQTSNAASLGTSNADSAAAAMETLGLPNTVVFYDMESYTPVTGDGCSAAVRAFLNAWVQEMNADGFATTAVYGSAANTQNDFSTIAGLTQVWVSKTPMAGNPPAVTIWGLGALTDTPFPQNQRAHQFLIGVGPPNGPAVVYGGVSTGLQIDYDVENLLIPGGEGTKQYLWVLTDTVVPPTNDYESVGRGINDIVSPSSPTFVNNGQDGEFVGYSGSGAGAACGANCWYGFSDSSGTVTALIDPQGPNYTLVAGLSNSSQAVGYYCYGYNQGEGVYCQPTASSPTVTEAGFSASLGSNSFAMISLGSTTEYTFLYGINDDAQIIGAIVPDRSAGPPYTNFLYQNGSATQLNMSCTSDFQYISSITGINGHDQIVGGYVDNENVGHGFIYNYEPSTGIGSCIPVGLPGGSFVVAINNQGQVLGSSSDYFATWLLDGGNYYELDQLYNLEAFGLSDAGQITGSYDGQGAPCGELICGFLLNPE